MEYSGVKLHNSITVGKIFSIHYFEYMNNFKFSGEAHNFWEFVYIDKGEAGITHNKSYTVEGADIFLDYISDQSKSMSVLYRTQIS